MDMDGFSERNFFRPPLTKEEEIERAYLLHVHKNVAEEDPNVLFSILESVKDVPEFDPKSFFVKKKTKRPINWARVTPGLKERLSGEQNHRCCHCGIRMTIQKDYSCTNATFEHVIPLTMGGKDHPDNMVVACSKCNSERGADLDWVAPIKAPCW